MHVAVSYSAMHATSDATAIARLRNDDDGEDEDDGARNEISISEIGSGRV